MLFNKHSVVAGWLVVRKSPSGASLVSDIVPMIHLQASVNIETKQILALGPLVHTLDFSWLVCLYLIGVPEIRQTLREILLAAPEFAAVLSYASYEQREVCLTGRLHEDLVAMSLPDVFDSVIWDLISQAEEEDPAGEVQPSAAVAFQAHVEVVTVAREADLTIDDALPMEVDPAGRRSSPAACRQTVPRHLAGSIPRPQKKPQKKLRAGLALLGSRDSRRPRGSARISGKGLRVSLRQPRNPLPWSRTHSLP